MNERSRYPLYRDLRMRQPRTPYAHHSPIGVRRRVESGYVAVVLARRRSMLVAVVLRDYFPLWPRKVEPADAATLSVVKPVAALGAG
jgi:hypothetical protein